MPQPTQFHASLVKMTNPSGLYDPTLNGYSHVAEVPPGMRLIFISGQGGESEDGSLAPDFQSQVRQALGNLCLALEAAGARPCDVAKLTVLIVDHSEEKLRVLGAEFERTFGSAPKPACTLIPVQRLALDGMLFEIEAVAVAGA